MEQAIEESERKNKRKRLSKEEEKEDDEDPWVEYEDEFGRTRIVRRSELPQRSPLPEPYSDEEEEGGYSMQRPGYDGSGDRSDMNHYEADREIRTKGVGFYKFSRDEQDRQDQINKLNQLRQETENARISASSASEKRKQMLAKNAEKIRARKAALQAKKHHQLKPEQISQQQTANAPIVNEDSISNFLKSMREKVE